MNDADYLKRAIALSEQSAEPVKCGCVIVKDGQILAETFNSQRADNVAVNHAEIKAVIAANQKLGLRKLDGATAYCSCEPCAMCLSGLSYAHVERIVFNQTMHEVSGDRLMGQLDSADFTQRYLDFVPKLERLLV